MQPCISNRLDIDRLEKDLTDTGYRYMRPEEVKWWKSFFEDPLATNGKMILSFYASDLKGHSLINLIKK
jgi:hypothetical protein